MANKDYTFEGTMDIKSLTNDQIKDLAKKYEIVDVDDGIGGNLVIEEFSNNIDDKLEYDLSLEVKKDFNSSKTYALKSNGNLIDLKKEFNEIISSFDLKPTNELKTRSIRLQWDDMGEESQQDFLIPEDTPDKVIKMAINIALAYGENECEEFMSIMNSLGYKTIERVEDIDAYDFNSIDNLDLIRITSDELNGLIDKLKELKDSDGVDAMVNQFDKIVEDVIENKQNELEF